MKKDKSWMTEDEPVCAVLPSHCYRVTVFGAIGMMNLNFYISFKGTTLKQGSVFMLADSTN